MDLFLLPKDVRCQVVGILLSAIKVDKDIREVSHTAVWGPLETESLKVTERFWIIVIGEVHVHQVHIRFCHFQVLGYDLILYRSWLKWEKMFFESFKLKKKSYAMNYKQVCDLSLFL